MKTRTRNLISGVAASMLLASPAFAENQDWSGFYAGAVGGYEIGQESWVLLDNPGDGESSSIGKTVTTQDIDGFVGGVLVGRNWQRDDLVWGLEAEFFVTDANAFSARTSTGEKPGPREWSTETNWVATVGPRLGKADGRNLFYIEGGLAFENADHYHLGAKGGTPPGTGTERSYYGTDTRYGIFVGAGIERAIARNFSGRFEYNFVAVDSGEASLRGNPSEPAVFDINQGAHTVKFGLVYHFK